MRHFMMWTEVANVFGFAALYDLGQSPEQLGSGRGKTPLIQPVKLDDVLALAIRGDGGKIKLKVGICVRKTEKQKGNGREEQVGQTCPKR